MAVIQLISVKCTTISAIVIPKPSRYSARCRLKVTGDSYGFLMSMVAALRLILSWVEVSLAAQGDGVWRMCGFWPLIEIWVRIVSVWEPVGGAVDGVGIALARRLIDMLWALPRGGRLFTPTAPRPSTSAA